jgi:DNA polymerase I
MQWQILDVGYTLLRDEAVILIYGKSRNGESRIFRVLGFTPYFYANPEIEFIDINSLMQYINDDCDLGYTVEIVDRYLPMGYQEHPTKLFKVHYTNPRDTRKFRESIVNNGFASEIYEADILFKNRFMMDLGLHGMGWMEVPGFNIRYDEIKPIDVDYDMSYRLMGFDIECLPKRNGGMPKAEDNDPIIIISMAFDPPYQGQDSIVLTDKEYSEKCLLKQFLDVIKDYDPDFLIGYNINEFDIPYIDARLNYHSIYNDIGRNKRGWFIRQNLEKNTIGIPGRIVVDLLPLVKKHANPTEYKDLKHPLKLHSLKHVSEQLLDIHKLDVKPSQMRSIWESDNYQPMIDYAERDAVLMIELYHKLQVVDKYIALSQASGALLQDVISGGQTSMIDNLFIRQFQMFNRVVPMKGSWDDSDDLDDENTKYEGAIVLKPKIGLHENIGILDFKSLYPSIMIGFNLSPDTIYYEEGIAKFKDKSEMVGIIPVILQDLYDRRFIYKKAMKSTTDKREKSLLNLKQYAMKILLNSIYGYFGYTKSRLFEVSIASKVTEEGRNALTLTKKVIEEYPGCRVIAGDTDSVFITSDLYKDYNSMVEFGKVIQKRMEELLPDPMSLAFEAFGSRGFLQAKKRYAIRITEDGKNYTMKYRGIETRRRDWCQYTEDTLASTLEMLLMDGDIKKAGEYAHGRIERIRGLRNVSDDPELMEQLILTKKWTKPIDQYKVKMMHIGAIQRALERGETEYSLGDRIAYYVVDKYRNVADFIESDKSKPSDLASGNTEIVEYVIEHNIQIDKNYYINKQLLPPLSRIFDILQYDVNKGKFMVKQFTLEDF